MRRCPSPLVMISRACPPNAAASRPPLLHADPRVVLVVDDQERGLQVRDRVHGGERRQLGRDAGEEVLRDALVQLRLQRLAQLEGGGELLDQVVVVADPADGDDPLRRHPALQREERAQGAERVRDHGLELAVLVLESGDDVAVLENRGAAAGGVAVAGRVEGDDAVAAFEEAGDEVGEARAARLPAVNQEDGPFAVAPPVGHRELAVDFQPPDVRLAEQLPFRVPHSAPGQWHVEQAVGPRPRESARDPGHGVERGAGECLGVDHAQYSSIGIRSMIS